MSAVANGMRKETVQYKSSITREQFMFYEMRATAKLFMEGLSDEEIIDRIISENLFQYPTEKQTRCTGPRVSMLGVNHNGLSVETRNDGEIGGIMKRKTNLFFTLIMILSITVVMITGSAHAELKIPENTTVIEEEAFFGDQSLTDIVLQDGLLRIEARAFADTSLQSIVLPRSLTYFAPDSFAGCPGTFRLYVYKSSKAKELCDEYKIEAVVINDEFDDLINAARAEGKLIVYGSCLEDYLADVVSGFSKKYGIDAEYRRVSSGEVSTIIEEGYANPKPDVWFWGTGNTMDAAASKGLLDNSYFPSNASHLLSSFYKDPDGYWYGVYAGVIGIFADQSALDSLGLEMPTSFSDLLKPEYKDIIWFANYWTAGMPKLVANFMIQMKGHDAGIQFLVDLDKNIIVYPKSGSSASKNVGWNETCVIGIGFVHDALRQIVDNGYDQVKVIIPADGTACEIGGVAVFNGAPHVNAARLFVEYALSPDCVKRAELFGLYQFSVLDNAQHNVYSSFGLNLNLVWKDYDFKKAERDTENNIRDLMEALGGGDERFKTE